MNKHLAAALLTASVAGAGFTGFTITSALAEDDGNADVAQVQLADGEQDRSANREAKAQTLANALGISVDDLMEAKEAGQTPAEIAAANGVSRDDLVDTLVQAKQDRLAEAVEAGDLTQDEADAKSADVEELVNAFVDGEGGHHRGGPGRGPDGERPTPGDGPDAEQDADEEADA
jgi:parvulin-like peptidyl-prolyl isomerase